MSDLPASPTTEQVAEAPAANQLTPFQQTVQFLSSDPDLKLTAAQAAGAARWMSQIESGLNPASFNPAGGGAGAYGIANWRGPRQQALLASPGADTLEGQLGFLKNELLTSEQAALSRLRATRSEGQAFSTFGSAFERPGGSGLPRRSDAAGSAEGGWQLPAPPTSNYANNFAPPASPTPLTPPPLATRPLGMLALLAAGTHQFIPVSYDPFKVKADDLPASGTALPRAPDIAGPAVGRVSASATPAAPYIVRTGMRRFYEKEAPQLTSGQGGPTVA